MTLNDSCHKHAQTLFHIHDMCHHDYESVMSVLCTPLQEKCYRIFFKSILYISESSAFLFHKDLYQQNLILF